MDEYLRHAHVLANRILSGRLRPGDRLPPQRVYARERGIAASTAARVYGELRRRGLVVGEVGRGTYVRAAPPVAEAAALTAAPPGAAPADLELTYPSAPGQSAALAASLAPLLRPDVLARVTAPLSPRGTRAAREAAARLFGAAGDPERVLFAGNGRQALAAAFTCAVPRGGVIGVEALTYPLVKAVAERLGRVLVPLPLDAYGIVPAALAAERPAALYFQPAPHNPTGRVMPPERQAELAEVAARLRIPVIEDRVWSFLADPEAERVFGALAPERAYVVESLSKRIAPGLTAGVLLVPEGRTAWAETALREGGWAAGGFAVEAAARLLADGTAARLAAAKRADAARRQRVAAGELSRTEAHASGYFTWWHLPAPWRAEPFAAAARAAGIAVTPGAAFAVPPYTAPHTVRLGLAALPVPALRRTLRTLAALAAAPPA
ncbi:aminotransferase class I/II-fold pyridoxal phosphate-dependent enzyme [Streptomyces sp. SPB074]|uniref:aminotransferase class I/II-fold pyridoxal phosphate-dependent enzyme n=1 Tax=Streptomyces sp. (strain SPB074) TaxID=465543 RepID=UPI0005677593|nr:aminotransferase class I/II-fold pyridoxal phosphate-dependent enzyme [Streptomyces sp. SPB074]